MPTEEELNKIENGIQFGSRREFTKDKKTYIAEYGLQKHAGKYKVFASNIEYIEDAYPWDDSNDYIVWDCEICDDLESALKQLAGYDFVVYDEMRLAKKKEEFFEIVFFY